MPMDYSRLFALMKQRGLSSYRIRQERILSQSTLQKLREGKSVTTDAIAALCRALQCQPGDLMTYAEPGTTAVVSLPRQPAAAHAQARVLRVPVLGDIAAGTPITAVEDLEGFIEYLPRGKGQSDKLFALRVRGESMIDAGIYDGDIVVVEQTPYAENGQIVAALVDDAATVKRFYKEKGHYRLQPENERMRPIIVDEVHILGRVVSSMRYY